MMAIGLVHYSQQWQASDLFRWTPLVNPAPLCQGARRAVLCLLGVPLLAMYAVLILAIQRDFSALLLLLPGMICDAGGVFLRCRPRRQRCRRSFRSTEEAKGAGRGMAVMVFSLISFALAGVTMWAWSRKSWFALFVVGETIVAVIVYATIHRKFADMRWRKLE